MGHRHRGFAASASGAAAAAVPKPERGREETGAARQLSQAAFPAHSSDFPTPSNFTTSHTHACSHTHPLKDLVFTRYFLCMFYVKIDILSNVESAESSGFKGILGGVLHC